MSDPSQHDLESPGGSGTDPKPDILTLVKFLLPAALCVLAIDVLAWLLGIVLANTLDEALLERIGVLSHSARFLIVCAIITPIALVLWRRQRKLQQMASDSGENRRDL